MVVAIAVASCGSSPQLANNALSPAPPKLLGDAVEVQFDGVTIRIPEDGLCALLPGSAWTGGVYFPTTFEFENNAMVINGDDFTDYPAMSCTNNRVTIEDNYFDFEDYEDRNGRKQFRGQASLILEAGEVRLVTTTASYVPQSLPFATPLQAITSESDVFRVPKASVPPCVWVSGLLFKPMGDAGRTEGEDIVPDEMTAVCADHTGPSRTARFKDDIEQPMWAEVIDDRLYLVWAGERFVAKAPRPAAPRRDPAELPESVFGPPTSAGANKFADAVLAAHLDEDPSLLMALVPEWWYFTSEAWNGTWNLDEFVREGGFDPLPDGAKTAEAVRQGHTVSVVPARDAHQGDLELDPAGRPGRYFEATSERLSVLESIGPAFAIEFTNRGDDKDCERQEEDIAAESNPDRTDVVENPCLFVQTLSGSATSFDVVHDGTRWWLARIGYQPNSM